MSLRRRLAQAVFICAIDAKLRGCDLVKLKVNDIAPGGALRDRADLLRRNEHLHNLRR